MKETARSGFGEEGNFAGFIEATEKTYLFIRPLRKR